MNPMYDTSKLTDDELLERIGQANTFMHIQTELGHTPTVESIKHVLESLELERITRFQNQTTDEQKKKNPKALDAITLGELDFTPHPVYEDEDERRRASKIKRRRL